MRNILRIIFVAIFFVPAIDAHAKCGPPANSKDSITCWRDNDWYKNQYTVVIISQLSAPEVKDVVESLYEGQLSAELNNIERALKKVKPRPIAFKVSRKGVEQTDCAIYSLDTDGSPDYERPQEYVGMIEGGKAKCREIFRRIGKSVNIVSEGLQLAGFSKILWGTHPNLEVRKSYAENKIDKISLYDLVHGFEIASYPEKFGELKIVEYPVIFEPFVYDNLHAMAEKFLGNKNKWIDIWAINRKVIDDPNSIKYKTNISIPSMIVGWKPVQIKSTEDILHVAEGEYGSKVFADFVGRVCSIKSSTDFPQECDLPKYKEINGSRKVLLGAPKILQ